MKTILSIFSGVCSALCALLSYQTSPAATLYVWQGNPHPTPPFADWATAATNIQDAVDAAVAGDTVLVTNGVYASGGRARQTALTNRVAMKEGIAVLSVNGPSATIIVGVPVSDSANRAIRCAYVATNSILAGFTLTNGHAEVGEEHGGGAWCESSGMLSNCVLTGNSAGVGGGAFGGCHYNCEFLNNSAVWGGGAWRAFLYNCIAKGNIAGEVGGGAGQSAIYNCTLTENSAVEKGGGIWDCAVYSSIVYHNDFGENYNTWSYSERFESSCTMPMPRGIGNITNEPAFIDRASGNLRLRRDSPCVNAGNNAHVATLVDLDGNERIAGGTVDMGAYEWVAVPTHYVSASGTNPVAPYRSWSTAATNIQDAVDAAAAGDEIVVTNGVYATGARAVYGMSNRVAVTKPMTVRSVNGPEVTSIVGYQVPGTANGNGDGAIRCVFLADGAVLTGFTLTNGATQTSGHSQTNLSGGGVWCEGVSAMASNCIITGNSACSYGGGAYHGTLNDCSLTGNSAGAGGGAYHGTLHNCTLTGNAASRGGGALTGTLENCALWGNFAFCAGGGAYQCMLNECMLTGNSAGAGGGAYFSTLNNCTLTSNSASFRPPPGGASDPCGSTGHGGGAEYSALNNCVLTGNSATYQGGGAYLSRLENCIVYYNSASYAAANSDGSMLYYCCTTPLPAGPGNLTNAPSFVNTNDWSNLRLQSDSPCINAGNNAYASGDTDSDGNPRIAGGTVDMGAYEFQTPASQISYAWLQQYGLPTDGSADLLDPDGDMRNNWQEWRCLTDPTNAASVLRLLIPVASSNRVAVTWPTVLGVTYSLERSTDLSVSPMFQPLATNLVGQAGTTTYLDTNAPGLPPRFYRVGVQY